MRLRTWFPRLAAGLLLAALLLGGLAAMLWYRHIHRFDPLIFATATQSQLDPALVRALIWRESRFRPNVVGKAGEIGLMQVTPTVGYEWAASHDLQDFAETHLFDPSTNLLVGTWYLQRAIEHWSDRRDPLPYALAQYNAGRSNALRWAADDNGNPGLFIDAITYPTTRAYIETILTRYRGTVIQNVASTAP
jgi:soluble lytic murein transglycosylase